VILNQYVSWDDFLYLIHKLKIIIIRGLSSVVGIKGFQEWNSLR